MQQITLTKLSEDANKVAAIKALRRFSGLSLKDAKEVIEALLVGEQAPISVPFFADNTDANNALRDFVNMGGEHAIVDPLEETIREALQMAMVRRKYQVVAGLSQILNSTTFDRPY